jgi:hypothetical protein
MHHQESRGKISVTPAMTWKTRERMCEGGYSEKKRRRNVGRTEGVPTSANTTDPPLPRRCFAGYEYEEVAAATYRRGKEESMPSRTWSRECIGCFATKSGKLVQIDNAQE